MVTTSGPWTTTINDVGVEAVGSGNSIIINLARNMEYFHGLVFFNNDNDDTRFTLIRSDGTPFAPFGRDDLSEGFDETYHTIKVFAWNTDNFADYIVAVTSDQMKIFQVTYDTNSNPKQAAFFFYRGAVGGAVGQIFPFPNWWSGTCSLFCAE